MSLCWKIYHFFPPYILKKTQITTPDAPTCDQNRYSEKKKIVQKSAFSDHRGAVKKW